MGAKRALLLLMCLCACNDSESLPDLGAWDNPVTGLSIQLPEGWRHSPDAARRGQTTLGYFLPKYALMLGKYGHVSLHHEDLGQADPPLALTDYAERLRAHLSAVALRVSPPVFAQHQGVLTARLHAEAEHKRKYVELHVRAWTQDQRHFWYAVVECLQADTLFAARAAPVVDLLLASTRAPAQQP